MKMKHLVLSMMAAGILGAAPLASAQPFGGKGLWNSEDEAPFAAPEITSCEYGDIIEVEVEEETIEVAEVTYEGGVVAIWEADENDYRTKFGGDLAAYVGWQCVTNDEPPSEGTTVDEPRTVEIDLGDDGFPYTCDPEDVTQKVTCTASATYEELLAAAYAKLTADDAPAACGDDEVVDPESLYFVEDENGDFDMVFSVKSMNPGYKGGTGFAGRQNHYKDELACDPAEPEEPVEPEEAE